MGHALCSVGGRDRLTLFCKTRAVMAAGGWLTAPCPWGALKMGTWLRELQIPVLKQKSLNLSAKLGLFSFFGLFSLHPSPFSTGKCIFCAQLVMHMTSSVETSISPAAFSGFWVSSGNNAQGFQPAAIESPPRSTCRNAKCTSVLQSRSHVLVPSRFPAFSFIKDDSR